MKKKILSITALGSLVTTSAYAAPVTAESVQFSLDTMWVMIAAILVFFMHAGFAMVESGFTRAKNTLNILLKNILTISIGSVLYFLVGYGIMFGSSNGFFGTTGFALSGVEDVGFFLFQAVFAATCATIISGAVAERMKLSSYLILTVLMTGAIYPVVGHWVWGGGWISELGFVDFAGSTVVHLTGAVGAFAAVAFLGARIGKYEGKKVNAIPGHNIPIGALGVFILWFGWFGFNGGSSLAADPTLVPVVISTTLLSASGGVIASALYTKIRFKQIDPSITLNGALGGLVGITAGTANVSLIGAVVIGLVAGVILVEGIRFIDVVLKKDDPVGAIAVHGICGIWGTLAVGLFDTANGLFYGGGASLLGVQAIGVGAVILWTGLAVSAVVFILKSAGGIRVSREEEITGLDYAEHGSNAYELKESLVSSTATGGDTLSGSLVERLDQLGKSAKKQKVYKKTV
ncbi:ammonium transporter [Jeotgalibacillus alimentarius]|uniref:Ammonium transporter n=1 Tax=Jeotgalibacillus alimentarius TaxID=135826 RepID=A0A0C2S834_9BACL|nr:ammonium transporter [Jeotgalibacillus alimentarius]KIL50169.1 ammonium transporter [Jeotgalibacillus alimentarius]